MACENIFHRYGSTNEIEQFLDLLKTMVSDKNPDFLGMLFQKNAEQESPLHILLRQPSYNDDLMAEIFELLMSLFLNQKEKETNKKKIVNLKNKKGMNLLMQAIRYKNFISANLLIPLFNVNKTSKKDKDALHYALKIYRNGPLNYLEKIKSLDIKKLITPVSAYRQKNIKVAIEHAPKEIIEAMINIEPKILKNVSPYHWTSFSLAINRNDFEIINMMFEKFDQYFDSIDVKLFEPYLSVSVYNQNLEIAALLLKRGANPNAFFNEKKAIGFRPISHVYFNKNREIAILLLQYGVKIDEEFYRAFGPDAQNIIDEATIPDVKVAI